MSTRPMTRMTDHKLYRNIVTSYVLILILPLIVLGIFSTVYSTRAAMNKETDNSFQNIMRTGQIFDRELSEMKDISVQLSLDSTIRHVISEKSYVESKYARWQALSTLQTINVTQKFPSEIGIYFPAKEEFLSATSFYDWNLFMERYPVDNLSQGDFAAWIHNPQPALESVSLMNGSRHFILYTSTLPGDETDNDAFVMMWIDWSKISPLFSYQNQDVLNHCNFIVGEDGAILYTSVDPAEKEITDNRLDRKALINGGEYLLNGERYLVSRFDSNVVPISYISMVSISDIVRSESVTWFYLLGTMIICVVFGGFLILLTSRRNYRPIYNLVNYIDSGVRMEEQTKFVNIEKAMNKVSSLYSEKDHLLKTLDAQLPYVESNILDNLVHGRYEDDETVLAMQNMVNMTPETDSYAVVIVKIDDYLGFSSQQDETMLSMASLTTIRIMKEMMHDSMKVMHLPRRKKIIFLLNLKKETQADESMIREELKDVQDYIRENTRIMVSMGVSGIGKGISQIPKCYEEAKNAVNTCYFEGNGSFEMFHEPMTNAFQYYYPADKENQFINKLTRGDAAGAIETLKEVYEDNTDSRKKNIATGYYLAFGMIGSLIKVINELEMEYDLSGLMKKILDNIIQDEERFNFIEDIQQKIYEIGEMVNNKREHTNRQQNHRIIQYLQDNYSDVNLSLTAISDEFGMSAPYLSRYFKEQFGMNFADYLCRLRISVSKKLLEDPKKTINEIAESVGYNSANSFIRTFKRNEGITPGQYRDQLKNE